MLDYGVLTVTFGCDIIILQKRKHYYKKAYYKHMQQLKKIIFWQNWNKCVAISWQKRIFFFGLLFEEYFSYLSSYIFSQFYVPNLLQAWYYIIVDLVNCGLPCRCSIVNATWLYALNMSNFYKLVCSHNQICISIAACFYGQKLRKLGILHTKIQQLT